MPPPPSSKKLDQQVRQRQLANRHLRLTAPHFRTIHSSRLAHPDLDRRPAQSLREQRVAAVKQCKKGSSAPQRHTEYIGPCECRNSGRGLSIERCNSSC